MMDFDRAMNVRVNGKEVNRVAFNGVTIWEKYTPASILLESDKSYASEGDIITLTATVYDKFGRGCPDKTVEFINDDTSELIATDTTNSNGIASVSYLVQGSEPLSIKAKCGIIVSKTCSIYDYGFYDDCTGSNVWSKYEKYAENSAAIYTTFQNYPVLRIGGYNNASLYKGHLVMIPCNDTEFSFSFDAYPTNTWNFMEIFFLNSNKELLLRNRLASNSTYHVEGISIANHGYGSWRNEEIQVRSDLLTLFVNGVQTQQKTNPVSLEDIGYIAFGGSYDMYVKNIKLKKL